jgi:hypothetical protein
MESKNLEKIVFENRAWEEAEYPRLHMKEPETFTFTEIQDFQPITREVSLVIEYHRVRSKWLLEIYTYKGIRCDGTKEFFNSIQEIKDYIQKKYNKKTILPKFKVKGNLA